jgi:hypothetical protein
VTKLKNSTARELKNLQIKNVYRKGIKNPTARPKLKKGRFNLGLAVVFSGKLKIRRCILKLIYHLQYQPKPNSAHYS